MGAGDIKAAFEALLFRWAGVESLAVDSRGPYVDARELAFLEKYLGDSYREFTAAGQPFGTYPSIAANGLAVTAIYKSLIQTLETLFFAQTAVSVLASANDLEAGLTAALESPYFAYSLLDFRQNLGPNETPSPTPGNLGAVIDLIESFAPTLTFGGTATYYTKALSGLAGMSTIAFAGDHAAYAAFVTPYLASIADADLRALAVGIMSNPTVLARRTMKRSSARPAQTLLSAARAMTRCSAAPAAISTSMPPAMATTSSSMLVRRWTRTNCC
jgi:hypothetical protein